MIGVRRHVRAGVATVLAGTASVLQMAAGVAETVAQELRLTLDTGTGDGDAGDGSPAARQAPARGATSTSVRSLRDVTSAREPRRLTAVDGNGTAPTDGAPFVPGGSTDVTAAEGEAVPRPSGGRAAATATADQPPPWVDDVAASVAGGTVREATARLPELTPTQLRAVERYERSHAGRVTLLRAIDTELSLRGE